VKYLTSVVEISRAHCYTLDQCAHDVECVVCQAVLQHCVGVQAEAALDTLNKKDLGEAKSLKKPPAGVDDVTAVIIILLEGNPKDKSWAAAQKLMNNVDKFLERLKTFKSASLCMTTSSTPLLL
jgi:hypothetical protein